MSIRGPGRLFQFRIQALPSVSLRGLQITQKVNAAKVPKRPNLITSCIWNARNWVISRPASTPISNPDVAALHHRTRWHVLKIKNVGSPKIRVKGSENRKPRTKPATKCEGLYPGSSIPSQATNSAGKEAAAKSPAAERRTSLLPGSLSSCTRNSK
jgi:hypothetical protein